MRLQVDQSRGVLVSDEGWLCSLDCHTGVASLDLDGRCLRVRPLRWVEKNMLARFSHLGATFLRQQLIRTCLMNAGAEPLTKRQQEIVADLALWLADSSGGDEVPPLDGLALADVTFRVCRAMGLKPSDLDQRDAAEVEMLWMAAQRAETNGSDIEGFPAFEPGAVTATPFEQEWGTDDFTRVVIVPDPSIDQTGWDANAVTDAPDMADSHAADLASKADSARIEATSDSSRATTEPDGAVVDRTGRRKARSSTRAMQRQSLARRFRVLARGTAFQEIAATTSGEQSTGVGEGADESVTEFFTNEGATALSPSMPGTRTNGDPRRRFGASRDGVVSVEGTLDSPTGPSWTRGADAMRPTSIPHARANDSSHESQSRHLIVQTRGAAASAPGPTGKAEAISTMATLLDLSRSAHSQVAGGPAPLFAVHKSSASPAPEAELHDGVNFPEGVGLGVREWVRPVSLTSRSVAEDLAAVEQSGARAEWSVRDRLFEDLCEQLEEAVDQLGID